MSEKKKFDPRIIASITTGVLLIDGFGRVHEAMEFVMGRPIWTHEIPRHSAEMKRLVLEQIQDMPTELSGTWQETASALLARYGDSVEIAKGSTERAASPLDTAIEAMGGRN